MDRPAAPLARALQAEPAGAAALERPRVRGKFLFVGDEKYWVKGVTYGTFEPDAKGYAFPPADVVERDFAAMAAKGINSVRVYTVPPRSLLDTAQRHGLRVLVGMWWAQNTAFLERGLRQPAIEDQVRLAVRSCAGHPALLAFAIANEIPAAIVRWHGRRRIEGFLARLYAIAKQEDPQALVTYVNYPTTEYLELPFLDFVCFNVYLESRERFEAYLARLHNLAGERPLVMAEMGLDSRHHGEHPQAESLAWQLRSAFAAGCAGTFVFAWTDAWFCGGCDIVDWDFGITARDRAPKAALGAVREAYADVPFPASVAWPRISVVVCSYNGARTIRDTLEGLKRLPYPDFEVIVVNDGSTDDTPAIAGQYDVRLVSTENRGLSSARNTGWQLATGDIVAYIDDDAYPDPHWLHYLAWTFLSTDCAGAGGPNIAPEGDGPIAQCVANAPGGPVHVLLSDREAEHVPGCNMAFRRAALEAIGGFDARYRAAGDDVDVCWRIRDAGGRIGFHAAAMDWHHRRNSLAMYWRQQKGYGKAEALLEQKWPARFNSAGHLTWGGRLYGRGLTLALPFAPSRVYAGVWGSAPYQSLYQAGPLTLLSLPLMPEWYLVVAALAVLGLLGLSWPPLFAALPLLVLAIAAPIAQAVISSRRAPRPALTAYLHLLQPLARLIGRLQHGLTPWRRHGGVAAGSPRTLRLACWRERWQPPTQWIEALESRLGEDGVPILHGNAFEAWDLEARCGTLGGARALLAIEEHGAGKQLARWRLWPRPSALGLSGVLLLGVLALGAASDKAWVATGVLAAAALALAWRVGGDCALALGALDRGLRRDGFSPD